MTACIFIMIYLLTYLECSHLTNRKLARIRHSHKHRVSDDSTSDDSTSDDSTSDDSRSDDGRSDDSRSDDSRSDDIKTFTNKCAIDLKSLIDYLQTYGYNIEINDDVVNSKLLRKANSAKNAYKSRNFDNMKRSRDKSNNGGIFFNIIEIYKDVLGGIVNSRVEYKDRENVLRLIESDADYKYNYVCIHYNACRTEYLFSHYLVDIIKDVKKWNSSQIVEVCSAFASEFEKIDLHEIAELEVEKSLKFSINYYSDSGNKLDKYLDMVIDGLRLQYTQYPELNYIVNTVDKTIKLDDIKNTVWYVFKEDLDKWYNSRNENLNAIIHNFLEHVYNNTAENWDRHTLFLIKNSLYELTISEQVNVKETTLEYVADTTTTTTEMSGPIILDSDERK